MIFLPLKKVINWKKIPNFLGITHTQNRGLSKRKFKGIIYIRVKLYHNVQLGRISPKLSKNN
ncbi:MAG: hypothetical protein CL402_00465 [Acidiferrobacteraceae bacterium]|nr:hypothetical protein [Acidiferrobacteraceae bacterium]|tara:strand:+ start:273 stop:458 length:186 start_codon:yes stop_codon:yes gene_type:complete